MSIILDALKKARKDRREAVDLQDDAVFRQIQYEDLRKRRGGGQRHRPPRLMGCLLIAILCVCLIVMAVLFVPGWISSLREKPPESLDAFPEKPAVSPLKEMKYETSKEMAGGESATPTTPEPEPTKIILTIAPPVNVTPSPTPTPRITPTPFPTKTPEPTGTPTPTPPPAATSTPEKKPATMIVRPSSGFERPEDFGLTIGGVMWNEQNPMALVNGEIVKIGHIVGDMTITGITRDYIEMEKDGVKFKFKF